MAKKAPSNSSEENLSSTRLSKLLQGMVVLLVSMVIALSLASFNHHAPSSNWLGLVGHSLGLILRFTFGVGSYLIIAFGLWLGWSWILRGEGRPLKATTIYFTLLLCSFCLLLNIIADSSPWIASLFHKIVHVSYSHDTSVRYNIGGVPFYYLYRDLPFLNLKLLLSSVGTALICTGIILISLFLLFDVHLIIWGKAVAARIRTAAFLIGRTVVNLCQKKQAPEPLLEPLIDTSVPPSPFSLRREALQRPPAPIARPVPRSAPKAPPQERSEEEAADLPAPPKPAKPPAVEKKQTAIEAQRVYNGDFKNYKLPPASLLTNAKKVDQSALKKGLSHQALTLEETLLSFGIEAKVGEIYCGPTITSFEVHPAIGVKVQKIKALENDLALNMQAKSIRIIAPIPGKAAVGIEIPNPQPQEVSFKEMLVAYQEKSAHLHIPVLLGKTVSGEDVTSDLSKMPHCIIAGATGSGKSVCVNSIIMSIIMNARPDEIKLLMVDPKKVELTPYSQLPHMLAPVITEPREACIALNWLVKEMERRYEIFKHLGMRNIVAFNSRQINEEKESSLGIEVPAKMSYFVAIIDELADLMMVSDCDIETPITRIAQMARAVGIHLILATQRPSREVITGLIKANFPTRIAFKVASRVNSQIILDDPGAETLLGNGDMLFLPPGSASLLRAQGAYVRDEDINRVIAFICEQAPPNYLIQSFQDKMDAYEDREDSDTPKDSLYEQARGIVVQTGNASTTFLQRKLKVGYARAASIMDELEANGIISTQEGSKPRRVLVGPHRNHALAEPEDLEM
jgi:DNA segregation ATPase FtsK/SpoIIIE, S-DNA-T family